MSLTVSIRHSRLSRRSLILSGAASLVAPKVRAAAFPALRVGVLPFGTVQWEVETIKRNGFDRANGIEIEIRQVASPEAARIAFLSGSVDTIVQDILFAARLKAEGQSVLFLPQSSTEGELIAPAGSSIRGIADLKDRSIGVSGGALDKNWLVLRAVAIQQGKLDLTKEARPVFGAPPLVAAKVESGELDCGLLYWNQAARLEAKGYRRVMSTEELLAALGAKGKVAVGGYLFKADVPRNAIVGFRKAMRQAEQLLASDPGAWTAIRPLMKVPDDATFEALKRAYLRGIPRKSRAEEIADARAFFTVVAHLGGAPLVGPATDLPDDLYLDADSLGPSKI